MVPASPLAGRTVLITRERNQAESFIQKVRKLGGVPVSIPMISFQKRGFHIKPGAYDWLVFTSVNAVRYFGLTEELYAALGMPKIAAIGRKTKDCIEKKGFSISFMPGKFVAEGFLDEFLPLLTSPSSVLIPKGNLARSLIAERLAGVGHTCSELIVYENVRPPESEEDLVKVLTKSGVDILTFTSSSTVVQAVNIIEKHHLWHTIKESIVVCIGPASRKTAEQLGLTVDVCPGTYTVEQMLDELIEYMKRNVD
ncbi:uroporphyrinogen-III synthase [Peribacillus kribbensis]|uniref:uroporphyrinogen-III synthase n=1 Tax=Peribacillus kribbensis TaxID=356658 RepID=UPI00040078C3|nr:uroporphyrinogen-III synthase [Peribacillus kribbensis]